MTPLGTTSNVICLSGTGLANLFLIKAGIQLFCLQGHSHGMQICGKIDVPFCSAPFNVIL